MKDWTLVASTGERFAGFGPYVAAVDDAGVVAFQAERPDGTTGVFTGDGRDTAEIPLSSGVAAVTSHPDRNASGAASFYGELKDGVQGVVLVRDGLVEAIADTSNGFTSIGPAGPTMNDAGTVAFRADLGGVSGVFAGGAAGVTTVADTSGPWREFHGLPLVGRDGTVVFRGDRTDGVEGIYAASAGDVRTIAETGEEFQTLGLFPSADERGVVAFAATVHGDGGIFTAHDGQFTIVERGGAYESYRGALIAGGVVVRIATPRGGGLGLFIGPDPAADRLLAIGDGLFGSTVTEFAANPVSVNAAGQVAVRVALADGSGLILRAETV